LRRPWWQLPCLRAFPKWSFPDRRRFGRAGAV